MIKVNDVKIEQNRFPDKTLLIAFDPLNNKFADECGVFIINWKYEGDAELFTLICVVKHIKEHVPNAYIELKLPYIPHARQDRVKDREDVFTLKYFAETINSLSFDKVTVLDPHSNVAEALINNITVESPKTYIEKIVDNITRSGKYMNEHGVTNLVMFYPDEGAMKRYSGMITRPYAFGIKDRDWSTGQIKGLRVFDSANCIKDSVVLIIDDICSRGGTFYRSATKLRDLGAKYIFLYATHCENTILDGELLKGDLIDGVYTTNSLFTKEHDKIIILD